MSGVRAEFLALVRCPISAQPLDNAPAELLAQLNARITAGTLTTLSGQPLPGPVDGALVCRDGSRLYPVVDGVALLLSDDAIALPLAESS